METSKGNPESNELAIETQAPDGGKAFRLKVDWRGLGKALTKGVINVGFGGYASALGNAVDAFDAFQGRGAAPLTPAQQGWLWVHRATFSALAWTIRSSHWLTDKLGDSDREIKAFVQAAQAEDPILLTPEFFDRPAASPFFKRVLQGVHGWLTVLNAIAESERLAAHLCQEFPIALDLEERRRRSNYAALADFFQPPTLVGEAAKHARRWRRYSAARVEAIRQPLLNLRTDEPGVVCLEEIFVPLRAWYKEPLERKDASPNAKVVARAAAHEDRSNTRSIFIWLEDHIDRWLTQASSEDAVRVISGDPGCGKSSFALMWSAKAARVGRRVLYVPLDRIGVDRDAFDAIRNFAEEDTQLGCDPFSGLDAADPVVLILDGLDELFKVSEREGAAARDFVATLNRNLSNKNGSDSRARVLALLVGRPIVTHDSTIAFKRPGQRVDILRLTVREDDFPNLQASDELLADQRDDWWRGYGQATRRPIEALPKPYRTGGPRLDDITAQPLLNYLLALIHEDSRETGESLDITSVHDLYTKIFELLYRRKKGALAHRGAIEDQFEHSAYKRFLEEVAIAAWHTGDRSVTKQALEKRLKSCDQPMQKQIKVFYGSLEGGLFAILNSFFVSPGSGGAGVYAFTHKSFREFLTAVRIVREVEEIHEQLKGARRPNLRQALADWYELTSTTPIDPDLLTFLREEVAARAAQGDPMAEWRNTLTTLFEVNLQDGMPGYKEADTYREAERRAHNAETGLFVTLNACARVSLAPGETLKIGWKNRDAANALFSRIYDVSPGGRSIRQSLARLNLKGLDLTGTTLIIADLADANLTGANLTASTLTGATVTGADLKGATLWGTNLLGANLARANLTAANLRAANLTGANLTGANLIGADLTGANLTGANLAHVILLAADLTSANFTGANLTGAILTGADLPGADLTGTDL